MLVCATVRLDIRDDVLIDRIRMRSQAVGPFDPRGSADMMQSLVEYAKRWNCERTREAAVQFALTATRHGGAAIDFSLPCWAPPSLPDVRRQLMLDAMRPVI